MPYYKDPQNAVHFLSNEDLNAGFVKLLPTGCIEITADQAQVLLAPSVQKMWAAYQAQAQAALDASDMTALRCFKAGVAFPSEWLAYVNALRAILHSTNGDPTQALPTRPAYPANT